MWCSVWESGSTQLFALCCSSNPHHTPRLLGTEIGRVCTGQWFKPKFRSWEALLRIRASTRDHRLEWKHMRSDTGLSGRMQLKTSKLSFLQAMHKNAAVAFINISNELTFPWASAIWGQEPRTKRKVYIGYVLHHYALVTPLTKNAEIAK